MAAPNMTQSEVDKNYEAFLALLPELLVSHPGKFVVMQNGKPIDFFDSLADAVKYGHSKFGDMNFSVQEVTSKNINLGFYSYALHSAAN